MTATAATEDGVQRMITLEEGASEKKTEEQGAMQPMPVGGPVSEPDMDIENSLRQLFSNMLVLRATRAMMKAPHAGVFDATLALMAHNEWIVMMLIPPGVVTIVFNPEVLGNNMLYDRLGYDDPCVLIDTAPSNWMALMLYSVVGYFGFLHVHFKLVRLAKSDEAHLLNLSRPARAFIYISNFLFLGGIMAFSLCFLIPPTESVWVHTYGFIANMLTRFLANASTFVEYNGRTHAADGAQLPPITKWQYAFLIANGLATVIAPCMWMIEYARYDAACGVQGSVDEIPASECPHVPFLNGWWTMCWDYLWLACLFVTPYFLPHNPVFIADVLKLVPRDDANKYEVQVLGVSPLEQVEPEPAQQ